MERKEKEELERKAECQKSQESQGEITCMIRFSMLIKLSAGLGAFHSLGLSQPSLMVWIRLMIMTIQACLVFFPF